MIENIVKILSSLLPEYVIHRTDGWIYVYCGHFSNTFCYIDFWDLYPPGRAHLYLYSPGRRAPGNGRIYECIDDYDMCYDIANPEFSFEDLACDVILAHQFFISQYERGVESHFVIK